MDRDRRSSLAQRTRDRLRLPQMNRHLELAARGRHPIEAWCSELVPLVAGWPIVAQLKQSDSFGKAGTGKRSSDSDSLFRHCPQERTKAYSKAPDRSRSCRHSRCTRISQSEIEDTARAQDFSAEPVLVYARSELSSDPIRYLVVLVC